MRLVLGDGASRLLRIPPGVAHGVRNLATGARPDHLLHRRALLGRALVVRRGPAAVGLRRRRHLGGHPRLVTPWSALRPRPRSALESRDEAAGHGGQRVHRVELHPMGPGRASRRQRPQSRQAHLRRQPGEPGRRRARPALRVRARRHRRRQARARRGARDATRSSTSPRRSHVDRSILDPDEFLQHQRARRARAAGGGARAARSRGCCRSAPTRCTARSPAGRPARTRRCSRPTRTRRPRPAATCWRWPTWRTHGVPVVITRSSNNFGPYQYPEKVMPLFVTNALEDQPLPLYGDGRQVRDWLYVLDNCAAIDLVLRQGARGRGLQHRRRPRGGEPRPHARDPAPARQARER